MALIVLSNASLAFGHVPLLTRAAVSLENNERLGLIGRNGTGKSSLLKVLSGQQPPDDGTLQYQQGLRIASVAQEPVLNEGLTIFEQVSSGLSEIIALRETYETINLSESSAADHERLEKLQAQLDSTGGWNWEQRVQEVLDRLDLDPTARISTLSGGNRKRVALAQALVTSPDVLLLDEPTNHLDIDSIVWLENLLKSWRGAVIFVTHDRSFLDSICTSIIELDRGTLRRYPGNFTAYQSQKELELSAEVLANARTDKLLAQEEAWIRKGVEARRTRSVSRISRLETLRAIRAERREVLGKIKLAVASGERSGKIVAQLDDVSKSYDWPIVRDFSCTILRGDKVGLIGPNGAGKTTLLKLILGEIAPDSGDIKLGTKLEVAYFDQMRNYLDLDASLEDFISPGSEWVEINGVRKHVKSYLGDFLFPPQRASAPVKTLSGGERNRLLLARLFAKPANVLVLDEPTNDLDVETLDLLEQLLQDYSGTVFLVSHDRYFLDRVVTSVIAYEGGGGWRENVGGYEDWVAYCQRTKSSCHEPSNKFRRATKSIASPESGLPTAVMKSQPPKKISGKERQELAGIPDRIEVLEREQQGIHLQLADPLVYKNEPAHLAALAGRLKTLEEELAALMRRWEELLEKEAAA